MPDGFNVRLLHLPTEADIAREIARIEPYPERVRATAPKARFLTLHATGLTQAAAMILKQELLALDADCVISPQAYLGDQSTRTDAVIMGTARQYAALVSRLRAFPLGDLPALGDAIERLLDHAQQPRGALEVRGQAFRWGERTLVMGILNVTPDSFSGDGLLRQEQAIATDRALDAVVVQARSFAEAGADLLDIGGESTRPGAIPLDAEAERARVIPAIAAVRAAVPLPMSVDTWKAEVAAAALSAGADMINDIWGLRLPNGGWNEGLARVAAERQVAIILMHNRRAQATTGAIGGHYDAVQYDDLMGDIIRELRESVAYAEARGIRREHIIVDPGIGFGKTPTQNIEVLRRLQELQSIGLPILLGTSRKSFIGRALNLGPDQRVEGTGATVALGIHAGVDIVRVHDVAPMVRVAQMTDAIVRPGAWERMTSGGAA